MDLITGTFPPVMFRQAPMEQLPIEFPQKRLTGSTHLAHHKAFHYTKSDKVRTAGYTRLNKDGAERLCFTEYYEAVLKIKQWQERQDLMNDRGGAVCIKTMLFYAESRVNYKKNNDEIKATDVGSYFELIHFIHHGKLIALYAPVLGRVTLFDPIKRSRSTKERMNRILMRYCGCQLFQRDHEWYVFNPMEGDIPFEHCMKINILPSYSSQFPE